MISHRSTAVPAFLLWMVTALAQSTPGAPHLSWKQTPFGREATLEPPATRGQGFRLLPPTATGVTFTNILSDQGASENQIRLNGSGVALGDVNGDGWTDIYFCGLESPNALFLNSGGWKFTPAASSPSDTGPGEYNTGATFADVDGDRDLDLVVNGIGTGTRLYLNDGSGSFRERQDSGLLRRFGATTSAFADVDSDGDLDLYVAAYRTSTIRTTGFALLRAGQKMAVQEKDQEQLEITPEGKILEHGERDTLYLNDGTGRFRAVSWTDGRFLDEDGQRLQRPPLDWGLTAAFQDLDGDGFQDLYVCNDFHSTDKVWLNDGAGKFRALDRLALRNTSTFSMAVDFADLNQDGFDDIFVADMLSPRHGRRLMQWAATEPYTWVPGLFENRPQFDRNTLHLSRGDGTFAEVAQYCGIEATDWTWSSILTDVDLDGDADLLCATGHLFDTQDLDAEARIQAAGPWRKERIREKVLLFPRMYQARVAFRNRGDLTFEPSGEAWGFDQVGVSHGMALGDLDNDGDLDLVVNNLNAAAGLYDNVTDAPRAQVRLIGKKPNTSAIGARVRIVSGGPTQAQTVRGGGRYLSGDSSEKSFAAPATDGAQFEVRWPGGNRSLVRLEPGRVYEIHEGEAAENPAVIAKPERRPLFEDVSQLLNHSHHEDNFDDFARQPLLPRRLSQLGPGLAWFDLDDDGWDDLAIGSGAGAGGGITVFRNNGRGRFERAGGPSLLQPLSSDLTGIVGFAPEPGLRLLLAGRSGLDTTMAGPAALIFDPRNDLMDVRMPALPSMSGPLALSDIDGDGDLDLFIGGRCRPGAWPAPVSSTVFLNDGAGFKMDSPWSRPFADLGLVSGAVFADFTGDGRDDLLLALEWGPVRLFENSGEAFSEITAEAGLAQFSGWWNGVATGDFNNDGRIDFAASNWGWNTSYQSALEGRELAKRIQAGADAATLSMRMPSVFHGDLDGNGVQDVLEAQYEAEFDMLMPVRSRKALADAIPDINDRFPSHAGFNSASLQSIAGTTHNLRGPMRAPWLASTVFLNRGSTFEPVLLPPEAQFAPAFGICTGDFDGDLRDDIVLVQNFFGLHPTAPRLDAGRGLMLRGDGTGNFAAVPGQDSGILIYGEGRGAAVADYDRDGRLDLVASQNGAGTKLYRNVTGQPGLRVRLKGPPENPDGVGARVRLSGGRESGPARSIGAGGGYWSQDSSVTVLAKPSGPLTLRVHWPGGKVTESVVPPGMKEVIVRNDGGIQSME